MYTFFSITPEKLAFEIECGISRIISDDRRLVLSREGFIYKPNYAAMAQIADYYYRGEKLAGADLTFVALRTDDFDYITNVSGKKVLENCSYSFAVLGGHIIICIKRFGFTGTPTQLLRNHGMIYYHKGVNALRIEEKMNRSARYRLSLGR